MWKRVGLKIRRFLGLTPTSVEVTGENLVVEGILPALPPSLILNRFNETFPATFAEFFMERTKRHMNIFLFVFVFCDARTFKKLKFLEQSELLLQHSSVVTLHLVMTTVSNSRGVFKTGSNIYNGVFSEKIVSGF